MISSAFVKELILPTHFQGALIALIIILVYILRFYFCKKTTNTQKRRLMLSDVARNAIDCVVTIESNKNVTPQKCIKKRKREREYKFLNKS